MRTGDAVELSLMINCADAIGIGVNSFFAVESNCIVAPRGFEELVHDGDVFLRKFVTVIMLHCTISPGKLKTNPAEKQYLRLLGQSKITGSRVKVASDNLWWL